MQLLGKMMSALGIRALHWLEPCLVLLCFIFFAIKDAFFVIPTAPEKRQPRHTLKVVTIRVLSTTIGCIFFMQGLRAAYRQWQLTGQLDPPADQFVYLQVSSVIWVCIGLKEEQSWFSYLTIALVGVLFESALAIVSPYEGFAEHLSWAATRVFLLWVIFILSLLLRQKDLYVEEEEQQPLLSDDNSGVQKSTASEDDTQQNKSTGDDDAEDDDWGRNNFINKKQRKRLEESGNWWTYMKAYTIFIPYLIPRKDIKTQLCFVFMLLYLMYERVSIVLIPRQSGIVADELAAGHAPYKAVVIWLVLKWLTSRSGLDFVDSLARNWFYRYSYFQITTASFDHILNLGIDFHEDSDSAELMAAVEQGYSLTELVDAVILEGLPCIVDMVVAFTYFGVRFGIYAAYISALAASLYLYLDLKFNAWSLPLRKNYIKNAREERKVNHEAIEGWKTITYFNQIAHESTAFRAVVNVHQDTQFRYRTFFLLGTVVTDSMRQLSFASMALLVVYMIHTGRLSVGSFVFLITYWGNLWSPVQRMSYNFRQISQAFIDAERLLLLLQTSPSVVDSAEAQSLNVTEAKITFDAVDFSYDERKPVLKGIDFTAKGGTTVALVGETGSGKSTILKVLHRFYDVTAGAIRIDGQDIRDVTLSSLRDAIGIVPQEPILFNHSIMDNVRYARLNATDEEIYEVCKAAAIHDRILSFPDGYMSKVGARGVKLSGGEKQRVAIARCLLKNPRILLLDEASSAIDSETEALIQDSLKKLCAGRTTIAIAHRLSTIMHADQILVVDEGQVVERGTHRELLALQGKYSRLWNVQIAAAIGGAKEDLKEELIAGLDD